MSHITKEEYLSAFVDGEAGSFEQHRICDQLVTDEVMREKLANFALIGETIKNRSQASGIASSSFLSGIQNAIADDAPMTQTENDSSSVESPNEIKANKKRAFPKQSFGYAAVASVAAVAAISFQNYIASPEVKGSFETAEVAKPINVSSVLPQIMNSSEQATPKTNYYTPTVFKAPDAETRGLMNKYVAHHLHYASSSTLMPRVRAVSYSTDF